ncbi:MAG: hypothetical protein ACT4QC_10745 [Planctomycetaceae bacterium]
MCLYAITPVVLAVEALSSWHDATAVPTVVAYVGPGPAIGMLGSLVLVVVVLALALIAPIVYPLRLFVLWLRKRRTALQGELDNGESGKHDV